MTTISLEQLPTWAKLEISKGDLIAFAQKLIEQAKPSTIPSVQNEEMMTVEQAADFLNLAKQTLYGMTSRKEIPHFKKTRKVYFRRSELEVWLLEGKQKTTSDIAAEAAAHIQQQKERRTKK